MKLRQIARAIAVTALTGLMVGVVPPVVAPVSAADPLVDCFEFPDDPSCVVTVGDTLTVTVEMAGYGGGWEVPVVLFNPAGNTTQTFSGTGTTPAISAPIPMDAGQTYGVSIDGGVISPFIVSNVTCSETGVDAQSSHSFVHVGGSNTTCTISLTAPAAALDVTVTSIGGVGTFDLVATGPNTVNAAITTLGPNVSTGTSLSIRAGYTYELEATNEGPWFITIECTDSLGDPVASDALIAEPLLHVHCNVTASLGVRLTINKFYDFMDPAPTSTTMVGSWDDEETFEVETGVGYTVDLVHGTHTITELAMGFDMTAVCEVVLDEEIISTTVDDGNGSVSFFAPRGSAIECTFSNSPMAGVVIEKRTSGGPEDTFTFTSNAGVGSVLSNDVTDPGPTEQVAVLMSPGSPTITESGPGGWTLDDVECIDGDHALLDVAIEGDTFTIDGIEPGGEYLCSVVNVASIEIEKTLEDVEALEEDGSYSTEWSIVVTNPFDDERAVSVEDAFYFPAGSVVGPVDVISDDGVSLNPDFDGVGDTSFAEFVIPGHTTYTFWITAEVAIEPDLDIDSLRCPDAFTGDLAGFSNWASVSDIDGEIASDWACEDIEAADIDVEKFVSSPVVLNEDGTYSQEYEIDIDNDSAGYGTFDLYDQPGFSPNAQVLDITYTDLDGGDPVTIEYTGDPIFLAEDIPLGANRGRWLLVTVRFELDSFQELPTLDIDTWLCATDDNDAQVLGHGLYNEAFLYTTDLEPQVASDCADLPISNVLIDKSVVGHGYDGNNVITVDFDIVATNPIPDEGAAPWTGFYIFEDLLFPYTPGITPTQFEILGVDGVDEDAGEAVDAEVVPDEGAYALGVLLPGNTHRWHIRATYTIDLTGFNGACPATNEDGSYSLATLVGLSIDDGEFGGLFNFVLYADALRSALANDGGFGIGFPFFGLDKPGRTERIIHNDLGDDFPFFEEGVGMAADCLDVAAIAVDKTVTNDDGGSAEPGDFSFQLLSEGTPEREMTAGDPYAVIAGDYDLAEVRTPGYTPGVFECDSTLLDGQPVGKPAAEAVLGEDPGTIFLEMEPSYGYTCAITNDDILLDLEVSIDDGDATATAGGAPITYEIIAIVAAGEVADGEDVTVTATLPSGWSWVAGTVVDCPGATIAGSTLTCVLSPEDLNALLEITFSAQARLAASSPSGPYEVLASITNATDPENESPACDDLNSDCDTTLADRAATITATKVSDAVGGSVARGATLKYTLTVTNQGPSTLLPGTLVTDDLPAGLTFVSASGAGWLCNSGDPVVCTYDSVVGVNASPPALVITTKVANSASGTLTNIGVFTGIVDQELSVEPTALLGQRRSEAVVTTATATASAVASVTVKSGSGGRGLPATGVDHLEPTMWVSAMTLSLGALALVFARRRRPARG